MPTVACESRITRVTVYARGAVVTRRVELPAGLGPEETVLELAGVTPAAEPASIRTHTEGERRIAGLRAPLHWRQPVPGKQPDAAAVAAIQRKLRHIEAQATRLMHRRDLIEHTELQLDAGDEEGDSEAPRPGIAARVNDAIRANALKFELVERYEAQLNELARQRAKAEAELHALYANASSTGDSGCERRILLTLAPGSAHLRQLEVSYAVRGARWWPAYAARISDNGRRAEFALEAFLCQAGGEDWNDVELSLCTADMLTDVRLPELPTLRLGRRQPPRPTGFREPPEGLDELFAGYDRMQSPPPPPPRPMPAQAPSAIAASVMAPVMMDSLPGAGGAAMPPPAPQSAPRKRSKAEPSPRDEGYGADRAEKEMAKKSAPSRSRSGAPSSKAEHADIAEMDDMEILAGAPAPETMPEPEPTGADAEAWLDFDALEMRDPAHGHQRGQLVRVHVNLPPQYAQAAQRVEQAGAPGDPADPLYARGQFDQVYRADGRINVPADGVTHRVPLLTRECKVRTVLRCVPAIDTKVYRESELQNPLPAALLAGPIDVFVDGVLLTTTRIDSVDRGGTVRFGLGHEQRVSVVRNVRMHEESKGLLGGNTAVDHTVSLEASNGLAAPIELELIERVPVSDDKEIKIEAPRTTPRAEPYDQRDRGRPVRGGLRFVLKLEAGAKGEATLAWRMVFDSGHELQGGNRRE